MPAPIRKLHPSCFRPSRFNFESRFTLLETRHVLDAFPAGRIIVVGPYQTDIGSRLRRKAAHGSHSRDFPVPRLGGSLYRYESVDSNPARWFVPTASKPP